MKTLGSGQTITILANLGVLCGILLLVYELAQNRQMMEAQTRTTVAQGVTDHLYTIVADEDIANLILRGDNGESLTDVEQYRYESLVIALFRLFENVHYQYRNGLYDEEEFAAQRVSWESAVLIRPGIVDVWCRARPRFSPELVSEINALLTAYTCQDP